MQTAQRIGQAVVLINLVYALFSFLSDGRFIPLLPLEEFFAAILFFAFAFANRSSNKVLALLYISLALILLLSANDFLAFFLSDQSIRTIVQHTASFTANAEISLLALTLVHLLINIFNNRRNFQTPWLPIAFFSLILLATIASFSFSYLLYFSYLALGLAIFFTSQLFFTSPKKLNSFSQNYTVFIYHGLLILTNVLAMIF
jgi:hypothetical protein